jgi:hypothetical protein
MGTTVNDEQAERIDQFLGAGTYDTWHVLDVEADMQLSRKKKADAALWHVDHSFSVLSPYGTDWVEKLQYDCAAAIELIKQNKFPDPAPFYTLLKIFPVALDAADLMLQEAEAIPTLWLVAGAAAVPVVGFTATAGRLHQELMELDELLSEAQAEEVETEIKAFLGVVITTVELFVPGLGLLAKGGLAAAEVYLAGGGNTASRSKVAKFALESIEDVEKASHTVKHIAGRGGKFITLTGYYFDVEEVLHAKHNVKKIKDLIEKTTKEFNEIKDKLSQVVKSYERLQHIVETSSRSAQRAADEKRWERDDLIQQYAYSIVKPIAWKLVDDYSKFTRR